MLSIGVKKSLIFIEFGQKKCILIAFLSLFESSNKKLLFDPEPVIVDLLRSPGIYSLPGCRYDDHTCCTGPPSYIN